MDVEAPDQRMSSGSVARPALLNQFVRTVRQQGLFVHGQHLLVAVSGGPDSIALLSLLHRLAKPWRLTLTVVHCNYALRGAESDGDESFVASFCRERHLPFVVHRPKLVKRRQYSSLQALARDARYDFMKQLAHEVGADRIAVGHTADDQAETVLMWLLRGAGTTGLAGMPYVREDGIIRPLLASTRKEVLAYLDHQGLTYRRDSSNDQMLYYRNRIRKQLLPAITQLTPAAVSVLQRQADLLREDEQYLEATTGKLMCELVSHSAGAMQRLNRQALIELPVALQRRLVRAVLRTYDEEGRASSMGVVESVCRVLLRGRSGTQLLLKQAMVSLDQETVRFSPVRENRKDVVDSGSRKIECLISSVPATISWAGTKQQIHVEHMDRCETVQRGLVPSAQRALFDADRYSGPLFVRSWRAGDRFVPQGMKGRSKKLQDFFIDRKIPRYQREIVPLLVAPEGILWVVGMRQDERFVVSRGTANCLVVSVSDRVSEEE
ncbi:MAG: tRNA lysidine(34) synthetase TilS [Nitrospiraceae bacterium]|nr:tRNA lysidine(34) synthetase TilS [Nitrospiraceae bacterium]